jgi:hypothetical protein
MRAAADNNTVKVANKRKAAAITSVQTTAGLQRARTYDAPMFSGESAGFVSRGEPCVTSAGLQIRSQSSNQWLADEFLQQLESSDVFTPLRATFHTLGARIRTTIERQPSGEIRVPITYDSLFDAREKLIDIRHERDCVCAQRNMFSRRRAWLFFEDAGSTDAANRRWQMMTSSAYRSLTSTEERHDYERFMQDSQLWRYSREQLVSLQRTFQDGDIDDHSRLYPWLLPTPRITSRWHTNNLIPEDLSYCLHAPDVVTFESPVTEHCSVLWFHTKQLDRCRRAGISPPIAQGPPKFFTSTDDRGRLVYHGFGSTMPTTMQDLFVDELTWDHINDWIESYLAEIQRVEGGYRFVPGHVIGGKDGVDFELETMHEMYRRCVWHNGGVVDGVYRPGVPVPVDDDLPDSWTQVQVFDVYRSAVWYDIPDMEICSMMALYGITSRTACSGTSSFVPNYQGAWRHLKVLQDIQLSKQEDFGLFPRLTETTRQVQYWPTRVLPRTVVEQEKDDGRVKHRGVTDAGARRSRILLARQHQRRAKTQDVLNSFAAEYASFSSSSPPGEDSPNFCIPESTLREIRWGKIPDFAQAIDILMSADLPCDVILRDFKSWYEEWARCPSEVHLCGNIDSSQGVAYDTQCAFGWGDAAHLLSRCNYAILHVIQCELDTAQHEFDVVGVDTDVKQRMLHWSEYRRAQGYHGRWTSVLPFIDDNTVACISANGMPYHAAHSERFFFSFCYFRTFLGANDAPRDWLQYVL